MYWIPGKLRTPLHRRSGREGSRASRGGPGRGTFRKSIGMAVYSGFLCVAPPWPSSRSWFCFEGPDPFPCPGKFVGSFSRQSRCSAPPFPNSMSVSLCRVRPFSNVGLTKELDLHTCSHFCYAGAPLSQCPGVPMPAHRKWLLPAAVVWLFPTCGRLIVGGWEHAASRIRELEPCARPTPQARRSGIKPVVPWSIFSHDTPCENVCPPNLQGPAELFPDPLGTYGSARLDICKAGRHC